MLVAVILDEVLGHPAAREHRRRVRHGQHAHDIRRDLVVPQEVFFPFDK